MTGADSPPLTRRALLGVAGSAALAGCTSLWPGDGDGPSAEPEADHLVLDDGASAVLEDVRWYERIDWRTGGSARFQERGGVGLRAQ